MERDIDRASILTLSASLSSPETAVFGTKSLYNEMLREIDNRKL
jgi:hypothetical protein